VSSARALLDTDRTMSISVIIVSWNARAFLLKCVASILEQRVAGGVEIIVVDNASSDGSPDAVAEQFPAVRVLRNDKNYGFAKGNNIGIAASSGDFLFLINSDVVVRPGCFEAMLGYLAQHPGIGVLGPRIVGATGDVQRSCMSYPTLGNSLSRALALDSLFPSSRLFGGQLLTYWQHDDTRAVDVINGCFWAVRRAALAQVGLLDERFRIYGEDVDWCKRFNDDGWKVVFFPGAEALHYGGASSANAPVKFHLEMQRANYQYWQKHHSRLAAGAFLLVNLLHHVVRLAGDAVRYATRRHAGAASGAAFARSTASIRWTMATLTATGSARRLQSSEQSL